MGMRVEEHVVLGRDESTEYVSITVDGRQIRAKKGEMVIASLLSEGIIVNRLTKKHNKPRGLFCGIGQCTDCVMIVNGRPNVRTCVTPVEDGMMIETQIGLGKRS